MNPETDYHNIKNFDELDTPEQRERMEKMMKEWASQPKKDAQSPMPVYIGENSIFDYETEDDKARPEMPVFPIIYPEITIKNFDELDGVKSEKTIESLFDL
jgi:hypothetical protein